MTRTEIFLVVLLILIALVRFFFFIPEPLPYDEATGKKIVVNGMVSDIPDIRETTTRLTIRPTGEDSNLIAVVSNISDGSDARYGDVMTIRGMLDKPENFTTTAGNEFNYNRYLANKDIYFIINNADVEILSGGEGSKIKQVLFRLREHFMNNINRVISPPKSDLANGLLLGARGGFNTKTRDEFINTGTIHIVALSGYNVSIVAEQTMRMLGSVFSQTIAILIGGIFIVLFVLMSGAQATAVRAGVMALIMLFARITGRPYDAGRALIIAGLLMIAYDPRVITDLSFQLSFIATFGVLFITPKVISWVHFLPYRFGIREITATTISATIATLPLILYSTGVLSIVSIPANILVLPFLPPAMFFAFCSGVLAFISPLISLPFAYIAHIILSYILGVIHFFASFSFASTTIKSFPLLITIILYILILWWVFRRRLDPVSEEAYHF